MLIETLTSPAADFLLTLGLATSLLGIISINLLSSRSTELHGSITAVSSCAEHVISIDRNGQFLTRVLDGGRSYGKLWDMPERSIRAGKWARKSWGSGHAVPCGARHLFPFPSKMMMLTICFFSQAMQFGTEDNSTVVIVPFGAWGKYKNGGLNFSFSRSFASSGRWA